MAEEKKVASNANKRPEVAIPSLEDFLKAGSHFGHKTSRWNPKMKPYIYATRNGVHIIDLVKSMSLLSDALKGIQKASDEGYVLFVGTKGQAATIVQRVAEESGAFYVNSRWPGGLFTNFEMIKKSVDKLVQMEETLASGAEGYVKKEQLLMERDVQRLNKLYEGIKFMDRTPKLVVVIDSKFEKNAIREAKSMNIPIVALMDTNCDPDMVQYPVPANDDSIKSISLFLELFGKAVSGSQKSDALIALRRGHHAKLASVRAEYEHGVELKKKMEEEERERMKKLRSGLAEVESQSQKSPVVRVVKSNKAESKAVKTVKIGDSKLGTRVKNALTEAGYKTLSDLKGMAVADLTAIKGIGEKAAEEIMKLAGK